MDKELSVFLDKSIIWAWSVVVVGAVFVIGTETTNCLVDETDWYTNVK